MLIHAFRGEHGPEDLMLISRLGSLSFGSYEAALAYATTPNNRLDTPVEPRIIHANLSIEKPLIDTPDDPFLELQILVDAIGLDYARAVAIKHQDAIQDTNHWKENYATEHESVSSLLNSQPEALTDLYLLAYKVLDDAEVVALLQLQGFDGAIHAGSGVTAFEPEYKVFDRSQVTILDVEYLRETKNGLRPRMVA